LDRSLSTFVERLSSAFKPARGSANSIPSGGTKCACLTYRFGLDRSLSTFVERLSSALLISQVATNPVSQIIRQART
jgi:hypothetical protein